MSRKTPEAVTSTVAERIYGRRCGAAAPVATGGFAVCTLREGHRVGKFKHLDTVHNRSFPDSAVTYRRPVSTVESEA